MLVGSMSGINFPSDQCQVPEGSSLYVFSDGTYEIEKPSGGMLDLDEFVTLLESLQTDNGTALTTLSAQITEIQGHDNFEDDFSIMKLDF
jgi:phosphoserine phosphatase RsbU/P